MNANMFRAVADIIEREDRFDLGFWAAEIAEDGRVRRRDSSMWPVDLIEGRTIFSECRTVGCVAGWVNALTEHAHFDDAGHAASVLGIDLRVAQRRLFSAEPGSVWSEQAEAFGWRLVTDDDDEFLPVEVGGIADWSQITAVQAAKVLRMIADGEVPL